MYLFIYLANEGVSVSCLVLNWTRIVVLNPSVEFLKNVPFGFIGWFTWFFSPWISCWADFATDFLMSVFLKRPSMTMTHLKLVTGQIQLLYILWNLYSCLYTTAILSCTACLAFDFRIALWINWRTFPFLPFSGKVLIRLRITAKFSNE